MHLFRKRMKQQEPPVPSATQHLTPPIEESHRMSTPLGDEDHDIVPVKKLMTMGFSRTEAVDALERNGYDVQKALNNLLSPP
jgi:epidermal growth factor receptor substrate 15